MKRVTIVTTPSPLKGPTDPPTRMFINDVEIPGVVEAELSDGTLTILIDAFGVDCRVIEMDDTRAYRHSIKPVAWRIVNPGGATVCWSDNEGLIKAEHQRYWPNHRIEALYPAPAVAEPTKETHHEPQHP